MSLFGGPRSPGSSHGLRFAWSRRPCPHGAGPLVFEPGPPSYSSLIMLVIVVGVAARLVFMWLDGASQF